MCETRSFAGRSWWRSFKVCPRSPETATGHPCGRAVDRKCTAFSTSIRPGPGPAEDVGIDAPTTAEMYIWEEPVTPQR